MKATKTETQTTIYTTFSVPLEEVLAALIPEEERHRPLCQWWANSEEGKLNLIRSEMTTITTSPEK